MENDWTPEDADEFFSTEKDVDYTDPFGWDEPAEYPF